MTKDYQEEYSNSIDQYHESNDPKAQVAALNDAIRLADAAGDIDEGYHARMLLVACAIFSGQEEKALVAFSWCLAQRDRQPDLYGVQEA